MTGSLRTSATIVTCLDHYIRLVGRELDAPVVCISLIDREGWLTTSSSGLRPPAPMLVTWAFLKNTTYSDLPVVIEDARADHRAAGIPAVSDGPVAAFLGMPIVAADGYVVGTLSAMADKPRRWTSRDLAFMRNVRSRILAERGETRTARHIAEKPAKGRYSAPGPGNGPSELIGDAP